MTTMNAFADSFDYADIVKCGRHIRDLARACITKTNNLKEGLTGWEWAWMDKNERFYEMSEPYYENIFLRVHSSILKRQFNWFNRKTNDYE